MDNTENKENTESSPKTENEKTASVEDTSEIPSEETVSFTVMFNKQKYSITFALENRISDLKKHLENLTKIPEGMQKLTYKGILKDESTLREAKITKTTKILLIGSTVNDLLKIGPPDGSSTKSGTVESTGATAKEPLSKQKPHCNILEKYGKPDDAMIGVKGKRERLPPVPITGMYNSKGAKIRLTFKMEQDEVWISTKDRTNKVKMQSIHNVSSEPINGSEEYHMMAIQLGPTEQSRLWLYWVPSQYVNAIKDTILGQWQKF
ncbi:DgyrCDS7926 [Dimorphilus gyrociliatus]|uniref:DgyrCDS7926 n=1 Tax=Dimorphilus gyrociliatus TaxID=2664684 RepID=A0A7I8VSL2_9ANNE|nr:DgyrCDS7926 [Dimorphilus gyrociliatus]